MLSIRLMPVLLVSDGRLVKTTRFRNPVYVGDPVNTVRIFNEIGVDEVVVLDISASRRNREPDFGLVQEIAQECFMPLSYGGGIKTRDHMDALFLSGVEKVVVRSAFIERPELISEAAEKYGSQAVVAAIDVFDSFLRGRRVVGEKRLFFSEHNPVKLAETAQALGAGEIFLTSVSREGTWAGFDLGLVRDVSKSLTIPLVAHGGAGSTQDVLSLIETGLVSGVALGSMTVFQGKGKGVLVNFPSLEEIGLRYRK
jgi:imidazole glycerol-phosphate synthase subunit HisF